MPLTDQQRRFCEGIVSGLTAKDAYIAAGYKATGHGAEVNAGKLRRKPEIADLIEELRTKASTDAGVNAADVLRELKRIGFFDIRKVVEWGGGDVRFIPSTVIDDDTAAAIQEIKADITQAMVGDDEDAPIMQTIKMQVKMASKLGALTKLGEHLNLFESEIQKPAPTAPPPATYVAKDMSKPAPTQPATYVMVDRSKPAGGRDGR